MSLTSYFREIASSDEHPYAICIVNPEVECAASVRERSIFHGTFCVIRETFCANRGTLGFIQGMGFRVSYDMLFVAMRISIEGSVG
jgi:hypothetical protein